MAAPAHTVPRPPALLVDATPRRVAVNRVPVKWRYRILEDGKPVLVSGFRYHSREAAVEAGKAEVPHLDSWY